MATLTLSQASHLARRTGFAALSNDVESLMAADSLEQAVDWVVFRPASLIPLPEWHDISPFGRAENSAQRNQNKQARIEMARGLKYWWFQQMVDNTSPLQEKMTLFWANHFTSSLQKVKWPPALLAQNLMLRKHAVGSFRDLLEGILKDPAMLIYLDNANSKKQAPNENLARELLELFTMGEGNYSEIDIKELARALTGASVNRRTANYQFKRRLHDNGTKSIFGEEQSFTPDDVAELILKQPEVGPFIVEKLWQFFVGEAADKSILSSISQEFVNSDYQLSVAIKSILTSSAFWASAGNQIKSPMELMVGSVQLFNLSPPSQRQVIRASKNMGQDLFNPPNVKGWPGGKAWYSTSNLAFREKVAAYFARKADHILPLEQILAVPAVALLPDESAPQYLASILSDPAFQVV